MRYKTYTLILLAAILFTTCKKYPKNNLWFKSPKNTLAKRDESSPWKLTYYSVNNVDSTNAEFLKIWREKGFYCINSKSDVIEFWCLDIIRGFWQLSSNKKVINFMYGNHNYINSPSNSNYINQRNIFLESNLEWRLDKLCPDEFRIINEYKGRKYEIHFK